MLKLVVGVDPGKQGGVAWMEDERIGYAKMPDTPADLADLLCTIIDESATLPRQVNMVIEKLGQMPRHKDGRPKQSPTTMFKMGRNYGVIEGVAAASKMAVEIVDARTWQREFDLIKIKKNETRTEKKNRHKARAQQLFPHIKMTHAISDALLITEWARRATTGTLRKNNASTGKLRRTKKRTRKART